jgi:hypothetical protein
MERLLMNIPPPSVCNVPACDWASVEEVIGSALPSDYQMFVETYGAGSINDFLWIFTPGSSNEYLDLFQAIRSDGNMLRGIKAKLPEEFPIAVFPEPGGVLPFGATDNGDLLLWDTSHGNPDMWSVVIVNPRDNRYCAFPGSMIQFLEALISGEWSCVLFPGDLFHEGTWFSPSVSS